MELCELLREIKYYRIFSPQDWEEYLAGFSDSDLMGIRSATLKNETIGEIARRIRFGRTQICQALDLVSTKIVTPGFLKEEKRRAEMTLGVVSGCFDLLHLGHVKGMQYAKDFLSRFHNGKLCVLTLSDRHIRMKKGRNRPILDVNERFRMITGIRYVDYAILLDTPDCLRMLKHLKPDWYFKSEQDVERDVVRREVDLVQDQGGLLQLFPDYVSNITSTTEIIERIRSQPCSAEIK